MQTYRFGAIYAIIDTVAFAIAGNPQLLNSDAAAIRRFGDVLAQQGNPISDHPDDHILVCLGELNENFGLQPPYRLHQEGTETHVTAFYREVITGKAWKATQATGPQLTKES